MKSTVYFVKASYNENLADISKKLRLLYEAVGLGRLIKKDNYVALKMHFGEKDGEGFIRPEWVKVIVDQVRQKDALPTGQAGKPFLTDTTTVYIGPRTNAVDHLMLAYEHGFSIEQVGCPVIIGDGLLGENQISLESNSTFVKQTHLAGIARLCDVIISLSHPTGHLLTGYGGSLKNIGMGLAGRGGKLAQHSGVIPQLTPEKCQGCGHCIEWCPKDAITIQSKKSPVSRGDLDTTLQTCLRQEATLTPNSRPASGGMKINPDFCIGCGECFAVCPQGALNIAWDESSVNMQKKMIEYVAAILKDKKAGFINFATHISKHCDCMGKDTKDLITSDLGILASLDPVALDMATIDLINQVNGHDVFKKAWPDVDYTIQLTYAEKLGLGSRDYQLKEL